MSREYQIAPRVATASRRVSALAQAHGPDDPRVTAARRDLEVERLAARAEALRAEARRVVEATAPPISDEQLRRLRPIWGGHGGHLTEPARIAVRASPRESPPPKRISMPGYPAAGTVRREPG